MRNWEGVGSRSCHVGSSAVTRIKLVLLCGYLRLLQWGTVRRLLCFEPHNYQGPQGGLWGSAPPLPLCFCGTDAALAMLRVAACSTARQLEQLCCAGQTTKTTWDQELIPEVCGEGVAPSNMADLRHLLGTRGGEQEHCQH